MIFEFFNKEKNKKFFNFHLTEANWNNFEIFENQNLFFQRAFQPSNPRGQLYLIRRMVKNH